MFFEALMDVWQSEASWLAYRTKETILLVNPLENEDLLYSVHHAHQDYLHIGTLLLYLTKSILSLNQLADKDYPYNVEHAHHGNLHSGALHLCSASC